MSGRGGKWFKPPCHCELIPEDIRKRESRAWHDVVYHHIFVHFRAARLTELIANSEYIDHFWICKNCRYRARRKTFLFTIFLHKLRIIDLAKDSEHNIS